MIKSLVSLSFYVIELFICCFRFQSATLHFKSIIKLNIPLNVKNSDKLNSSYNNSMKTYIFLCEI